MWHERGRCRAGRAFEELDLILNVIERQLEAFKQ